MNSLLKDRFNRVVRKLRISVTDHCNLRCTYCMPEEGLAWLKHSEVLTYEEINRLSRLFVSLGVQHIRLTGGEPLMRRDLNILVNLLAKLKTSGLQSIGLTTNGVLLEKYLPGLKQAGLDHVNISLDTVDPERFTSLTKRNQLNQVIKGIECASTLYPGNCKINAVVQRGFNEDDIWPLIEFAQKKKVELRFIEKMPLEAQNNWSRHEVITGQDIRNLIASQTPFLPTEDSRGTSPAERIYLKDKNQNVGLINSVTEPFCAQCDRLRLTADGALRNCLFATSETSLKIPLRAGATDHELEELIRKNVWEKWEGHQINQRDFTRASRPMSQIGG